MNSVRVGLNRGWLSYIGVSLLLCVLVLPLAGFLPFTGVNNVCPRCPTPKLDVLVLTDGQRIAGQVISQTPDHYVVERFGEHRAVAKEAVATVEWRKKGRTKRSPRLDVVVMKNGLALCGKIISEDKGRYFIVRSGRVELVAWQNMIESVYKAGRPYPLAP